MICNVEALPHHLSITTSRLMHGDREMVWKGFDIKQVEIINTDGQLRHFVKTFKVSYS